MATPTADAIPASQAKNTISSKLEVAKRNVNFLIHPESGNAPARRRTRALLRSLRYIGKFLFWRLVRYAKYAAVGAVTAAIAGTAFGSVISGAAFVIAPPGILAGAGVGLIWGLGKFGWRTFARRVRTGETDHANPRMDEKHEKHESEPIRQPRVDPW